MGEKLESAGLCLKVTKLGFAFQSLSLFEKLSFDLKPGELLHLKGPNGSGKSTLLSILAGLRRPLEGEIEASLDGKALSDLRYGFSYLAAESNGLYPRLSAVENLRFWSQLENKNVKDDILHSVLKEWGLGNPYVRTLPTSRFSTGMKRRLGLARLQMTSKACLLLDEPLNGLDTEGIKLFKDFLKNHLEQNGSAVLVSHDVHKVEDLITKEYSLR